jgi:hypothetical protein
MLKQNAKLRFEYEEAKNIVVTLHIQQQAKLNALQHKELTVLELAYLASVKPVTPQKPNNQSSE